MVAWGGKGDIMHGEVVKVDAVMECDGDDSNIRVFIGEGGGDANEEGLGYFI